MSRWEHPAFSESRWEDRAACRDHPTSWWFIDSPRADDAFAICSTCDVRTSCLSFALAHVDLQGIWGATTSEQRTSLRRAHRERRSERPAPPAA